MRDEKVNIQPGDEIVIVVPEGTDEDEIVIDLDELGIDIFNFPTFVLVSRASEVLNIPKQCLESDDVKIDIDCDENCLLFNMFVENSKICSVKCPNSFGIPNLKCLMDSSL